MLAYAPRRPGRAGSPRTLILVAGGHLVILALLLTTHSGYIDGTTFIPTEVIFVPTKPPPPPLPVDPVEPNAPTRSTIDTPPVIIPTPMKPSDPVASEPPITAFDPIIGNAIERAPTVLPEPPKPIVRRAARFITPAEDVRPPYPVSKQRLEEEASLRLALAIDARGRVTSVTAVGAADPVFLDAARRHILRHWRYQPASEGGEAIASSIVVTLTFKLEE